MMVAMQLPPRSIDRLTTWKPASAVVAGDLVSHNDGRITVVTKARSFRVGEVDLRVAAETSYGIPLSSGYVVDADRPMRVVNPGVVAQPSWFGTWQGLKAGDTIRFTGAASLYRPGPPQGSIGKVIDVHGDALEAVEFAYADDVSGKAPTYVVDRSEVLPEAIASALSASPNRNVIPLNHWALLDTPYVEGVSVQVTTDLGGDTAWERETVSSHGNDAAAALMAMIAAAKGSRYTRAFNDGVEVKRTEIADRVFRGSSRAGSGDGRERVASALIMSTADVAPEERLEALGRNWHRATSFDVPMPHGVAEEISRITPTTRFEVLQAARAVTSNVHAQLI